MIEFRLHEGKVQYRTWAVWIDDEDVISVCKVWGPTGQHIEWTEWQDVPMAIKVVVDNDHR